MPKNVVDSCPLPDFLVTTLDEETEEEEEASLAMDEAPAFKCVGEGLIDRPKSHSLV